MTGDQKEKHLAWPSEKRGPLSLFACKILVVLTQLSFLRAGTCLSPGPFPSLLATSVCNRLLLHTRSFLTILPDSSSLRPALGTHGSPSSDSLSTPTPGALFLSFFFFFTLYPGLGKKKKKKHAASPCLTQARAGAWRVQMWDPAPRAPSTRSYSLPRLLIRLGSLALR